MLTGVMKKRLIALFLSILMVCTLFPVSALAESNTVTVTLDPNGGSISEKMQYLDGKLIHGFVSLTVGDDGLIYVTIDQNVTGSLDLGAISALVTKDDSTILAYWQDADSEWQKYDAKSSIYLGNQQSYGRTAIAQWRKPATVSIHPGEGSFRQELQWQRNYTYTDENSPMTYSGYEGEEYYGSSISYYINAPEGKSFSGFCDSAGTFYPQSRSVTLTNGMTLTAQFGENMTLKIGSGDGKFDSENFYEYYGKLNDENTEVATGSYVGEELYLGQYAEYLTMPVGKVFAGWEDENGIRYRQYDSVIVHKGMTLTALFADARTITFDAGEGTFKSDIDTYDGILDQSCKKISLSSTDGESIYIGQYSYSLIAPQNKSLAGWTDQNGNSYADDDHITVSGNLTLTARYAESIDVVISAGGGRFSKDMYTGYGTVSSDGSSVTKSCPEGTIMYLSRYAYYLTPPANSVLTGWTDNQGNSYDTYDAVYAAKGLVFTPVWTEPVYVTAYANGGYFRDSITKEHPEVTLSADRTSITIACAPGEYLSLDQYSSFLSASNGYLPVAWADADGVVCNQRPEDCREYYCYWGRPAKVTIDLAGGTVDNTLGSWNEIDLAADHRSLTVSGGQGEVFYLSQYSDYFRSPSGKGFAGLLDSNGKRYRENSEVFIINGEVYTAVWEEPIPVTISSGEGSFTDGSGKIKTVDGCSGGQIYLSTYSNALGNVEGKTFCGWRDDEGNVYEKNRVVTVRPGLRLEAIYRADGELPKLATPTDLTWNLESVARKNGDSYTYSTRPLYGSMYYKCPASQHQGRFKVTLYNADNDTQVDYATWHFGTYYDEMDVDSFICDWNGTGGRYYFTVQAIGDGINYDDSDIARSGVLDYQVPQSVLPRAAKPYWGSGENANTAYFTAPATSYSVGYEYEFYYAPVGGVPPRRTTGGWISPRGTADATIFDETIQENGYGCYYIRVRNLSYDVDKICSGPWSPLSDARVISGQAVTEKLDELIASLPEDAGAQEIIDTVKASVATDAKKEELRTALLADGGAAGGVEDTLTTLEEMTGINLEIKKPEGLFDNGEISIIGAKLNAAEDAQSVSLNISQPTQEQRISENLLPETQYKNTLQFVMDLGNAAKDSNGQLAVPVKIKMPIPVGINPRFLVILHEHHDGTLETINWPDFAILQEGGINYVSFVVTDFSTFAFAEASVMIREENGTVTASTNVEDTQLLLAFYDGNGKMLACKTGTDTVSAALPDGAVKAKAFVVAADGSSVPQLAPALWER